MTRDPIEKIDERSQRLSAERKYRALTHELNNALSEIDSLSAHIEKMENTLAWRIRTALRLNPKKLIWWSLTLQLSKKLRERRQLTIRECYNCENHKEYRAWIAYNDRLTASTRAEIKDHIDKMTDKPLISVVMPVYNTSERYLSDAIGSVRGQLYSNWELCIADDASPSPHVWPLLQKFAAEEPRIKIMRRTENGNISASTNSALELATGDFIALMDHDDLLPLNALYEVAVAITKQPDVDLIYSDEDHIDENGLRFSPYFKPDFSESLLLGHNMVSHFGVYRRELIRRIGGFRLGLEGSQDYDLVLRASAATTNDKIHHIPKVLYHWRKNTEAQSFSEIQLEHCLAAARRAITDYLAIKGQPGTVVPHPDIPSFNRVLRRLPDKFPLVSVVIPTKDRADLLAISTKGVLSRTDYHPLELIIVDNNSEKQETFDLFAELKRDERVTIIDHPFPFNYSEINNLAVHHAKGEILAFLHNDIEVLDGGWLKEMVSEVIRPEVGAVGAKLYYPDGRIQHAGVVIGLGRMPRYSFSQQRKDFIGYFGLAVLKRNVSAVTAACVLVKKSIFDTVGGFNETSLPVTYNDIDLCLKIRAAGYQIIWTPYAELNHHKRASPGFEDSPEKKVHFSREWLYMLDAWPEIIESDPFYNSNFSLDWGLLDGKFNRGNNK